MNSAVAFNKQMLIIFRLYSNLLFQFGEREISIVVIENQTFLDSFFIIFSAMLSSVQIYCNDVMMKNHYNSLVLFSIKHCRLKAEYNFKRALPSRVDPPWIS